MKNGKKLRKVVEEKEKKPKIKVWDDETDNKALLEAIYDEAVVRFCKGLIRKEIIILKKYS